MSAPIVFRKRCPVSLEGLLATGFGWVVLAAGPALGAPAGELDATFGENGRLTISLAGDSFGWAVAQQADGKLLIGGATDVAGTGADFAIIRLNANGTRDNSFDGDGVATIDFAGFDDIASSFAVQPDGKIITAGFADVGAVNIEYDFALARLNADGTPDLTFNGNGRVTLDVGGSDDYIVGVVLLGNGQIVVAGSSDVNGDYDAVFARFNANGSLDTNFGTSGTTLVDSSANGSQDQPFWLTVQPLDGKFIACGPNVPTPYNATNGQMLAVRVNTGGTVDTGFGTNGVALVPTGTTLGAALSCVAMPDGTTVLAGFDGDPGSADLSLARLTSNGALDMTFGTNGLASPDLGGTEVIQTIILLADGKLGVTGLTATVDDNIPSDMFLARIDPVDGSLDTTFGNEGVTIVDFGLFDRSSDADGLGLIQQADGKLVAVGTRIGDFDAGIPNDFAIARVDPAGAGSAGYAGFVETVATVGEGTANVVLIVRRTGGSVGSPGPVSVAYSTVGGTATAPGDFTAVNGVLQWADGDMAPKTIAVPITDDTTDENIETFAVILNNTTGTVRVAASELTVVVTDNDVTPPPPPAPPPSGGGGGGGATGIELLALLGLLNALGLRRSRRLSQASLA